MSADLEQRVAELEALVAELREERDRVKRLSEPQVMNETFNGLDGEDQELVAQIADRLARGPVTDAPGVGAQPG